MSRFSRAHAEDRDSRENAYTNKATMEILTALAIAPLLAALVLGAREAELKEQNNRSQKSDQRNNFFTNVHYLENNH